MHDIILDMKTTAKNVPVIFLVIFVLIAGVVLGYVLGQENNQQPGGQTNTSQSVPAPSQETTLQQCLYNAGNNEANEQVQQAGKDACYRKFPSN